MDVALFFVNSCSMLLIDWKLIIFVIINREIECFYVLLDFFSTIDGYVVGCCKLPFEHAKTNNDWVSEPHAIRI